MTPTIAVTRLPHADGLPLPAYETSGAAGMDLPQRADESQGIVVLGDETPGAGFDGAGDKGRIVIHAEDD